MLQLRNRYIMPPIKLGYSDGTGIITDSHLYFYKQRSKHIGAITLEPLYLDARLRELPTQIGIDNDDKIDGLKQLTDIIHNNGAKVIAHLNHAGRNANPKIPGNYLVSSTDKPCEAIGVAPKRMNKNDITSVINLFKDASIRAEKAGFDIIELQLGHGYLAAQFMSPAVNDRTDEYGGTFENRIRFSLELLDAVKSVTSLPIIIRISGDEMIPDGLHVDEIIKFINIIKTKDISAVHVSSGSVCHTPPWFFHHMFVDKTKTWDMAKKIKDITDVPVIFVGQINSQNDLNTLINEYNADYIAVGRAMVADPDFIKDCLNKDCDKARPCMACAESCLGGVKSGKGLQCLANPDVNKIHTKTLTPITSDTKKKVAVVGGGLAGIQAALTIAENGHTVTIFEKNRLGGQFVLAALPPKKHSLQRINDYLTDKVQHHKNIKIIYKEASVNDLNTGFNDVVIATGSVPKKLNIKGLTNYSWAEILIDNNIPENKNILIIGGGLIGIDVATALIKKNNKVIIVKRTTDFGEDMEMISKKLSLKMMKESGVAFSDYTHITKVDGKTVYAKRNGKDIQFKNIDKIIVSAGMVNYNPFEGKIPNSIKVHIIGDAANVGKAHDAITDGYFTGLKI